MENELKIQAVKLSHNEQYLIRKNIVYLLKEGKRNREIAEILDVSKRHVKSVKKIYSEQGLNGIKPKKRGREKVKNIILNQEQEKEIRSIIIDKTPEQLGFNECQKKFLHFNLLYIYFISSK